MHIFKLKVYYEDTDAGGVVYHANYLKFFERARSQILTDNLISHTSLKNKFKLMTIVKSCNINYIKPAKLDYNLEIITNITKKSKVQMYIDQKIYYNKICLVEGMFRIVIVNIDGKVSRLPSIIYNIF